jgi:tetratricopeptide (TPR) repeat protein
VPTSERETPVSQFTRQDVLRILHLESRHLAAWEREGLVVAPTADEQYTFAHLSRLRTLRELKTRRISVRSLRIQFEAMQQCAGIGNALNETSAIRLGSRLIFRHGGALLDPTSHQLAFDFASAPGAPLELVHPRNGQALENEGAHEAQRLQEMFARAAQSEERPDTLPQAIELYVQLLEAKPNHAPACINLGTIYYNQRDFAGAEQMYRRATVADPGYALAFFDLGNVLDETQQLESAVEAYRQAIRIVPGYADAHYNLALALERRGERRRALRHWTAYLRLDPVGPWAAHARGQAKKIMATERLAIVSRRGRQVRVAG